MRLDVRWSSAKPEGLILGWADSADARLESMLPEIVVHLIAAGEMCARANEHRHYQWRVDSKRAMIEDRKSVVSGKSVSVSVDLGGRRILKNKTIKMNH